MQVSLWMTQKPACTTAEDHLDTVAGAMEHGSFRQMPVVDSEGRLVGIVTQRDLREHKGYLRATKVSAAMTEPAIAVAPDDPIEHAAQMMLDRKIGGLPVIDAQRRVVGILTTSDLLRGFLDGIGGAEGTTRIDWDPAPGHDFAEAVQAVEAAGGTVLGLGTFDPTRDGKRRFFVRLAPAGAARAVEALRAAGFAPPASRTLRS